MLPFLVKIDIFHQDKRLRKILGLLLLRTVDVILAFEAPRTRFADLGGFGLGEVNFGLAVALGLARLGRRLPRTTGGERPIR